MIDETPVQSFDLPDGCEMDHVAIYPNDNPDGKEFYAVPYIHEDTFEDGTGMYNEPPDFEITEAYREAVARLADVSINEIKLTREVPTSTL